MEQPSKLVGPSSTSSDDHSPYVGALGQPNDVRLSIELYGREPANETEVLAKEILQTVHESQRIRVQFSSLSACVPLLDLNQTAVRKLLSVVSINVSRARGEDTGAANKQILHEVVGKADPGELVALMGPSGSGKTTLISILGGRKPKAVSVSGCVEYNGSPLTKAVKRKIGYVTQDDLMYETLTVYETLFYAALLRLPKSMSRENKKNRVELVIAALGLDKCRETLIGGPMMRGISGGERKRVAVGHELLTNPSVLMLDEPTSGLDSTTAMHLLTILRQLAEGGRSVITTIHQPSSRLYQQLDTLMLLSEGRCMYYGNAKLVLGWFGILGKPVPLGVNIADFMLDLANGDVPDKDRSGEQIRKDLLASFLSYAGESTDGITTDTDITNYQKGECVICPKDTCIKKIVEDCVGTATPDKWGAGFTEQMQIICSRALRTRRLDSFSTQKFVNILGVALITGLLWWRVGGKSTLVSAADVSGLIFFVVIFNQFNAMFSSLFTFPAEFQMIVKERSSGMYRLSAFYIARCASELPMDLFIPTLYTVIVYWMTGLKPTFAAFLLHWLSSILSIFVAQTVGLLIGAAVMNFKTATTVTSLFMLANMLVGGFYVKQIPGFISWIKYMSFVFYSYRLVMKIEFNGKAIYDCGGIGALGEGMTAEDECKEVLDLQDALNLSGDVQQSGASDALVLVGILIVFRIALYFVLKFKTKS